MVLKNKLIKNQLIKQINVNFIFSIYLDNFNIISIDSPENHYINYSIQGKKRPRSFIHQMTVRSMNYSFIAVDACMTPGPRRKYIFSNSICNIYLFILIK